MLLSSYMSLTHKSDVNLIAPIATEINNNIKKSMQSLSVSGIQAKLTFLQLAWPFTANFNFANSV